MGWACHKSGIVLARGQRLTGGATCVALQSVVLRCVAVNLSDGVSWRPPLATQDQTVINRSSLPPSCASNLSDQQHLLSRVPSLCCPRPVTALWPLVSLSRAVF